MPRASGSKEYISLVGGLITEASPLNFPENSTSDELNFLLDVDGGIRKRRDGFANITSDFAVSGGKVVHIAYWQKPNLVLVFLKVGPDTVVKIHKNDSVFTFVDDYTISTTTDTVEVAVNTELVNIVTQGRKPLLLEYRETTTQVLVYDVDLYLRDFELVDDGLRMSERPSTLSDNHKYNLLNAGWYAQRRLESSGADGDPIADFFSSEGVYPSNADLALLGMRVDKDGNDEFTSEELTSIAVGNTEAPRGHYIFNINDFDRNDALTTPSDDGSDNSTLTLQKTIGL